MPADYQRRRPLRGSGGHVWPVGDGVTGVVQNGIARSAAIHWLFDRPLISLTDDYRLLVSHNKVPSELRGLFAKQMDLIHLPDDPRPGPHPTYLVRHWQASSRLERLAPPRVLSTALTHG